jgi:hypothetical protein
MIYHPSITQRLNGLVDKKEESGEVTISVKYEQKEIKSYDEGMEKNTEL